MEMDQDSSTIPRPRLWRWVTGTFLIITGWQVIGFFLTLGLALFFGFNIDLLLSTADEDMAQVRAQPAWSTAATVLISFIPLFLITIFAYRALLRRPIRMLFTSREKYSWSLTWIGFASLSLILLAFGGADLLINYESYTWSWNFAAFLPYLLIALTLLPIQTTAEELFFRGWLQQWLDNGKRKQWSISLIGGLLFAAPHLANPEVSGNQLFFPLISYGATGFMLAWVTYRDKSLEIAIGAHFANNLLAALFISSSDSALPSVSLFTVPEIAWGTSAIASILIVPIFIWLTGKWKDKVAL